MTADDIWLARSVFQEFCELTTIVASKLVSRATEMEAVSNFLAVCCEQPACLLLEGEAGIGKTTLWIDAVEQARIQGMSVLTARAAETESVTAYVSLADLFSTVAPTVIRSLPAPQRGAVDRILLQAADNGFESDPRAIAAAFLSTIQIMSATRPVLLAIDDVQWLDPSSAGVVAYAVRRLSGPVGILGTVRSGGGDDDVSWLQLPNPDAKRRIHVTPMAFGCLREIVSERLKRSIPRQAMLRLHHASGGNPFYAIELGRVIADRQLSGEVTLPKTLTALVSSRIALVNNEIRHTLLAAACMAEPTVDLVSRATGNDVEECMKHLLVAEQEGIVSIDRNRLSFAHPLLTAGVYTDATPKQRRAMHARLAAIIDHPEVRARHMALAATYADRSTIAALDAAAQFASSRGAPAAAAEFTELARELGADTDERRIRCAKFYFNAGDALAARSILHQMLDTPASPNVHAEARSLLGLWSLLDGSSREAATILQRAAAEAGDDELLVQILMPLSFARLNIRDFDGATQAADAAVAAASRLGDDALLGRSLGMRAQVRFLVGDGFDDETSSRAVQLDDGKVAPSAMLWPRAHRAVLLIGTGRLDEGCAEFKAIRQHYAERGAESESMFGAFHDALAEIWHGNFPEASRIGQDALVRARQLGGDLPLSVAKMIQAAVASYAGDEQAVRSNAAEALAAMARCDSPALVTVWPTTTLAFLEVSLRNFQAALDILRPSIDAIDQTPRATEIFVAPFLPDYIEALIHTGRLDEAERLVEVLDGNGLRLNRPWMLAMAKRTHSMLLAARRDVRAALKVAHRAMDEHDRLPMPFERARTQLLLGDLQRRHRSRENAAVTLREALDSFEELQTPLWAKRARLSLQRIHFGGTRLTLTSSEQRVAELAAVGTTNQDIASALFISPKTVETHLSRIYRKLGIRSRAELGRRLDRMGDSRMS